MTKRQPGDPAARAKQLRESIRRHEHLYYVLSKPQISDLEFDALERELREIEAAHQELISRDSPTQRVGGAPLSEFPSVVHQEAMLSLENTYSEEEVREFESKVRRQLGETPLSYVAEPKIDGLSLSVTYEDGLLTRAVTRGDGKTGDDVTENARTIRSLPLALTAARPGVTVPKLLEARGEVYLPRSVFAQVNDERARNGEEPFVNPRNAASGAMKLLDPRQVKERGLELFSLLAGPGFGRRPEDPRGRTRSDARLRSADKPGDQGLRLPRRGPGPLRLSSAKAGFSRLRHRRRGGEDRLALSPA